MKNALILHGTANNSQGNWFPWLKQELEKRGWKVWVPDLPRAVEPNSKRYNNFILNSDWEFNDESIIVAHSSGAVATLGLLLHLPDKLVIAECILVAPFKENLGWPEVKGLFKKPFDFAEIKLRARQFVLIYSDNDPYVPLSHGKYLAKKLGGKLIIKPGQGHFNLEQGPEYKRFPLILAQLESDITGEGLLGD